MTREEEVEIISERYGANSLMYGKLHNDTLKGLLKHYQEGFVAGVKWADNNICLYSIWNDTSIMPSDNKGIIYLTKNNKFGVLNSIKSNKFYWYVADKYSIIKWAYIDDLLPKGGLK